MTTLEERMLDVEAATNQLDGAYNHLATKADLAQLETRLLKWMFGLLVGVILNVVGVAVAIVLQLT